MLVAKRYILGVISVIFFIVMLMFDIEKNFFLYKCLLGGVFFITFFSVDNRNLFLRYFLLFVFLFFVAVLVFVNDLNTLKYNSFYSSFSVGAMHVEWVYILTCAYLISVHMAIILLGEVVYTGFPKVCFKPLKNQVPFLVVLILLSLVVFDFYLSKIIAIQNEGYLSYHTGELSVKKSLLLMIFEVIFLGLLYWFLYHRSKLGMILFVSYNLFILLTGFRMPFICNILVFWIIYYPNFAGNFKLILVCFFISPPVLIFSQRYRMGSLPDSLSGAAETVVNSYSELFSILSFTLDTVKAAVYLRFDTEANSSIFYGVKVLFIGLYKRLESGEYLTVAEKINHGSFAVISTNKISPHLISEGVTAGSSFISEVFLPFGVIGVVVAGFFHVFLSNKMMLLLRRSTFLGFLIVAVLAPYFFRSARSGFIDWLFISFVYISIYYIVVALFLHVCKVLSESLVISGDERHG